MSSKNFEWRTICPPEFVFPGTPCLRMTNFKKANTLPSVFRTHFLENTNEYLKEKYKFIYTDGSKTAEASGCAYVNGNEIGKYKLPKYCSILTAELYAIGI